MWNSSVHLKGEIYKLRELSVSGSKTFSIFSEVFEAERKISMKDFQLLWHYFIIAPVFDIVLRGFFGLKKLESRIIHSFHPPIRRKGKNLKVTRNEGKSLFKWKTECLHADSCEREKSYETHTRCQIWMIDELLMTRQSWLIIFAAANRFGKARKAIFASVEQTINLICCYR